MTSADIGVFITSTNYNCSQEYLQWLEICRHCEVRSNLIYTIWLFKFCNLNNKIEKNKYEKHLPIRAHFT